MTFSWKTLSRLHKNLASMTVKLVCSRGEPWLHKTQVRYAGADHKFVNSSEYTGAYESLDLSEEEKDALRIEVTKKWKHPMKLYITVVVCSIGAAVQGWDQTGSNGANLSFPAEFGIGEGENPESPDYEYDQWIVGLVNAAPYIASAFLGCWCSDPLNYYFGRRGAIFISAIFLILTPIGGALSQSWEQLFTTRLLMVSYSQTRVGLPCRC